MRITVRGGGTVVITAPKKAKKKEIENFVREKEGWIYKNIERIRRSVDTTFAYRDRTEYLSYKEKAREYITARIGELNKNYGVSYNRISVKDLTSRWGSCSLKGNLNFNYKIIFLPKKLGDYVIVHELCHLKEFNHSSCFWRDVARTLPEYKELDKKIRRMELS